MLTTEPNLSGSGMARLMANAISWAAGSKASGVRLAVGGSDFPAAAKLAAAVSLRVQPRGHTTPRGQLQLHVLAVACSLVPLPTASPPCNPPNPLTCRTPQSS